MGLARGLQGRVVLVTVPSTVLLRTAGRVGGPPVLVLLGQEGGVDGDRDAHVTSDGTREGLGQLLGDAGLDEALGELVGDRQEDRALDVPQGLGHAHEGGGDRSKIQGIERLQGHGPRVGECIAHSRDLQRPGAG